MATPTATIKQGDSRPTLTVKIVCNANDTLSSGVFHMQTKTGTTVTLGGTVSIDSQPVLDTADNKYKAQVSYNWKSDGTDTATAGAFNGEFKITFNDGRVETYPNLGYIDVEISRNLT